MKNKSKIFRTVLEVSSQIIYVFGALSLWTVLFLTFLNSNVEFLGTIPNVIKMGMLLGYFSIASLIIKYDWFTFSFNTKEEQK